jgi:hypothetical protein
MKEVREKDESTDIALNLIGQACLQLDLQVDRTKNLDLYINLSRLQLSKFSGCYHLGIISIIVS